MIGIYCSGLRRRQVGVGGGGGEVVVVYSCILQLIVVTGVSLFLVCFFSWIVRVCFYAGVL